MFPVLRINELTADREPTKKPQGTATVCLFASSTLEN
jgi:hypothetical protein